MNIKTRLLGQPGFYKIKTSPKGRIVFQTSEVSVCAQRSLGMVCKGFFVIYMNFHNFSRIYWKREEFFTDFGVLFFKGSIWRSGGNPCGLLGGIQIMKRKIIEAAIVQSAIDLGCDRRILLL